MRSLTMSLFSLMRQSQNKNATKRHVSAVENKLMSLIHNMGLNVSVLKNQVEGRQTTGKYIYCWIRNFVSEYTSSDPYDENSADLLNV